MFKKTLFSLFIILVAISVAAGSDQNIKQYLKKGDVEKFCKTFPKMVWDFKQLGMKYDSHKGEMNWGQATQASQETLSILKRHGWDETFYTKAAVIVRGFALLRYGDAIQEATPEIAKALKQVDSNPHLSPEMKKQMKAQMTQAMKNMKTYQKNTKESIHPSDLKMIKPHLDRIEKAIDKKGGK